jgi:coenzyme F420 hydrogenase subunit beta
VPQALLAAAGSRYGPSAPLATVGDLLKDDRRFLFIGKPCDVAAAQKARKLRPKLDRNLALTVAFFCAGTPSTNGTLELLNSIGVSDVSKLTEVRYRGRGWPGRFIAKTRDPEAEYSCTYDESWKQVLSRHVQWRCRLCLDHTGEFADIAVGDPWYRPVEEGESGSSLILGRSSVGTRFIENALRDGALTASPVDFDLLARSQPNLLRNRGEVWGRILGARLCGALTPTYRRLPSFGAYVSHVPATRKLRSVLGSARRCVSRGIAFKSRM